jgi:predicted phosphodiesterase
MKIGILADIHGHVENLRIAIELLRRERVDQFVVLGDVICDRKLTNSRTRIIVQLDQKLVSVCVFAAHVWACR